MERRLAETPEPPYYAVIFSTLRGDDEAGYAATSERMFELAAQSPGFLGFESAAGDDDGPGITVSYWRDREAIRVWRRNAEHLVAQTLGRERWYRSFVLRVAEVTGERRFEC